jgi:hypothetical protein
MVRFKVKRAHSSPLNLILTHIAHQLAFDDINRLIGKSLNSLLDIFNYFNILLNFINHERSWN